MSDETKKLIEDLKAIRLELFRSAASLDDTIVLLEGRMSIDTNDANIQRTVYDLRNWRETKVQCHDWDHLAARERGTWAQLIDSVK